ncbi:D-2-hydroxyacid dehydrogenase [Vibrio sp. AH4]|uniref:D-2-hydroxyacid dehydrogenase n=1 Tax=Vibrio sp. AH4 TaxID=2919577 RepID=UPI0027385CAD|nr:D-2-hydroxyacid dehydrogenase [Vibrio sp. AH4]MDP4491822.1 D-2-hydroxyacid dehydrogenase [Vibrio sp. AH4]
MNNFHQLYILTEHDEHYRELILERQLAGLSVTNDRTQATILLAAPPMAARCLDEFPHLQWLHSAYAGVDTLMAPKLRKNYLLTNVKGIFGHLIAEYVMGYAIQYQRDFNLYQTQQVERCWQAHPYSSLANQTLVILGTGSIGSHLACVAKQFGLRVVGVNRTGIPAKEGHFDATYHISELLFNVGRGKTLVEQDLPDLIAAGHIRHAFLDVFIKEPLAQDHPFWSNPAITITPHIAAVSFPEQVVDIFADNYQRWCDNLPLRNQIDFEKGY